MTDFTEDEHHEASHVLSSLMELTERLSEGNKVLDGHSTISDHIAHVHCHLVQATEVNDALWAAAQKEKENEKTKKLFLINHFGCIIEHEDTPSNRTYFKQAMEHGNMWPTMEEAQHVRDQRAKGDKYVV